MSVKTTYKCDKCGKTSRKAMPEFWAATNGSNDLDEYLPSFNLCSDCVKKMYSSLNIAAEKENRR